VGDGVAEYGTIKKMKYTKFKAIVVLGFFVIPSMAFAQTANIATLQAQIQTLLAEVQALEAQLQAQQSGRSASCYVFTTNLSTGMTGVPVKALQVALATNGESMTITGTFDKQTISAVVAFQEKYKTTILDPYGLTNGTGFFGKATRAELNSLASCGASITQPPTALQASSTAANTQTSTIPIIVSGGGGGGGGAGGVSTGGPSLPITNFTLSFSITGTGDGTVFTNGVMCATNCFITVQQGISVTLTASPDGSSIFVGWAGACSGTNPSCTVVVNANTGLAALFAKVVPPPVVTTSTVLAPPSQAAGYTLAFSDDFDSLDLSPNGKGIHNWYNPGIWWEHAAPYTNITVTSSTLNLLWTNGQTPTSDTSIATAAPDGSSSHSWRYGYFEVRMKWNPTVGAWPALWMIPTQGINGVASETGELDIFEGQGASQHMFYGTVHDWKRNVDVANNGGSNHYDLGTSTDLSQYHTYGALWVPGRVTWYFDNAPIFTAPTYSIFDQQNFFLILGDQQGVNWTSGDTTGMTTTTLPMNVDWVRVWQ
jgi:peptidoglycan hydrolase-like protein with peptidoglycan-binding domain